ncbi:MAG: DUF4348 domain-containing protein [Prevotella sp.]|jgi:hypothetical protein|nr:DUF4348 domain-containing protein [Prevotella sp.]
MKRIFIAIVAGVLLMFSCTGGKTQMTEEPQTDSVADTVGTDPIDSLEQLLTETPPPKAMDELFDDFVFNFAANKKLQLTRIVFPLIVKKDSTTKPLDKGQWEMEHFFMRQGYYTLLFDNDEQMRMMKDTSITQAIVEKILLKKNLVKDYVFNRIRGAWLLREIRETPIEENVNASFLAFYQRFVTDKEFQVRSINKTVTFVGPDPDDDFNMMEGIITPDTWEAFAPQLPSKVIYNIIYGQWKPVGNEKIYIMRGIANGLELELRFKKVHDRWLLMKMTT